MALQIEKNKLLLVEGKDELSVFAEILNAIGRDDIQLIECGGNIQLKTKFPALIKSPGFFNVTSYAIVQDADNNAASALDRVQSLLRRCDQPVPTTSETYVDRDGLRVGIYILPGAGVTGMLEDLYLTTIAGTAVLECVDRFVADLLERCPPVVGRGQFAVPGATAKVRALGTLMATAGPHNRLGLAAKDGYWDVTHAAMVPLTSFIRDL